MIINISDVWDVASVQHYDFLNSEIDKGLSSLTCSFVDIATREFVESNRIIIVKGTPLDLIKSIEDFEVRFGKSLIRDIVSHKLKLIFNYEGFSKRSDKPWTAYHLCNQAKYKTCCYCQMVKTGTNLPTEEEKGYRPPIDHYYTKSDYPFLALTLSNFIPCCEKCNGPQMKHTVDFSKIKHLNPFLDEESIEFELKHLAVADDLIVDALALKLNPENYSLIVEAKKNTEAANESIKTFQLKSRYGEYSSRAFHLARNARSFTARKAMSDSVLEFELTLNDLLEFDYAAYKNFEYGKARVCIAKQYGAISD